MNTITDDGIRAWLGPAADDLTPDQYARFSQIVRAYQDTTVGRPDEPGDYVEEDTVAWVVALELVEGTLDVAARGRAYRRAQDDAYAGAVVAVLAGEMSEVAAAEAATVARATLRKALGK